MITHFGKLKQIILRELNESKELDVKKILNFIQGWDMGNYAVKKNWNFLEELLKTFPYQGVGFRATPNVKTKPPLSFTKDLTSLKEFWQEVGIPKKKIEVYRTSVNAIDLSDVARYALNHKPTYFRAKRLLGFNEIITLDIPPLEHIGWLIQKAPFKVKFVKKN